MCTAITCKTKDLYLGRTLDYDCSYGEEVVVVPRHFVFDLREAGRLNEHYAIIGMAHVADGYPLYYDGANEKGLAMAGLNFVGNAAYAPQPGDGDNIAPFELIPWILGQCATVGDARELLSRLQLRDLPFSPALPAAQLHWLIADEGSAITLEVTADGPHIYDNPVGVLTNNPPFEMQLANLCQYRSLSAKPAGNHFAPGLSLPEDSRGMGAIGLPGDLSSRSRFVRAAFVKLNAISGSSEEERVSQFFHILGAVEQTKGCCVLENGGLEYTIYSSCCNASRGIYYYTTYDNARITAVDLGRTPLDGAALRRYPLRTGPDIRREGES